MSSHARRFSKKKASKVTFKEHQKAKEMSEVSSAAEQEGLGEILLRTEDVKFRR